jgi:hypothetical protein
MMIIRFEDLWDSAGDGASSPGCVVHPADDVDALMDAWCHERHLSTECRLYLDRMRRMLREMLAEERVSPRLRRRAETLLRAVREAGLERGGDD